MYDEKTLKKVLTQDELHSFYADAGDYGRAIIERLCGELVFVKAFQEANKKPRVCGECAYIELDSELAGHPGYFSCAHPNLYHPVEFCRKDFGCNFHKPKEERKEPK